MSNKLIFPDSEGKLMPYTLREPISFGNNPEPIKSRIAYSAAHVVCDPLADVSPVDRPRIDWESTLAFRRYLWDLGLSVAEAMDTAQRGMGLDWETTKELIKRSLNEADSCGGGIACGAGTDHLSPTSRPTLDDVKKAYMEQCEFIEGHGGRIILMASRALAAQAKSVDDYAEVYDDILSQVKQPVILHWLGEMFDPNLSGYWGKHEIREAMEICLDLISRNRMKVHGIKISLLDQDFEIEMRRRLPEGVHLFTGDDFNYPDLIRGDEYGFSHALLGIFDPIAPAAAAALRALDSGDLGKFDEILAPTVPLSRHIFKAPTYFYKTGVVFMAYLNGFQNHFRMAGGYESARSIIHLCELFRLADQAGLLLDPELAMHRMELALRMTGINQV